jgi:hypothetical protein
VSYNRSSTAEGALAEHTHVLLVVWSMEGSEMTVQIMTEKVNDVGSVRHVGTFRIGTRALLRLEAAGAVVIGTLNQTVSGCVGVEFDLLHTMGLAKMGDKRSPVGIMALENDAAFHVIFHPTSNSAHVLDDVGNHN